MCHLLMSIIAFFSLSASIIFANPNTSIVKDNSKAGLSISYNIKEWNAEPVNTPKGDFNKLMVPGYLWHTNPGKPELPVLRRIITVPYGATPKLDIQSSDDVFIGISGLKHPYPVYPAQEQYSKSDPLESRIFSYNQSAYLEDPIPTTLKYYKKSSNDMLSVTDLGYMRNHRLYAIDFSPFMYNPQRGELLFTRSLQLRISFLEADFMAQQNLDLRYQSPVFSSVLSKFAINHEAFENRNSLLRTPLSYLILTPASFVNNLQPFVQWKIREGYKVSIKTVGSGADIENNSTVIKNYMQNLWNNADAQNPAPSFVLIVGDTPQITYSATYEYRNSGVWYQTDRNYFLLQGGDSIPEMYWGRFSATTSAQLDAIIAKTISYQQMNMPDLSYLNNAALIAGPDYAQGIPQNTPVTNNQVLYATSYFNAANGFDAHSWYSPASHNAASAIVSRINLGNCLVSYTGHGLENRWDGPVISSTGSNANKWGIVIGNACLTSTISSNTSYGESWLHSGSGGAVAYIGASCYSIWTPDFYWSVGTHGLNYSPDGDGVYDALFYQNGQSYTQWATSVGAMVFIGNMAVVSGSPDWASYYWAIYNVVGDPSTIPYMGMPSTNTAICPSYLVNGQDTDLIVSNAAPHSWVSLSSHDESRSAFCDADGNLSMDLSGFDEPGTYSLVISRKDILPIIQSINILSPNANPILQSYCRSGAQNQNISPNSAFSLDVSWKNMGYLPTGDIIATISSSDPYVNVNSANVTLPSLSIGQIRTDESLFDIFLAAHAPNNHIVHLVLNLSEYGSFDLYLNTIRPPSFPWVALEEDFESGQVAGQTVLGWSQVQVSGSNQWLINSQQGYLGGNCAAIQGISSAWIYKSVELTAGRPYKLRFRYKSTTATTTNYRIHFAVHTTPPTNITTWGTELYNANIAHTAWQLYNGTATFTPSSSGTYYFGFRANLINATTNFIHVDNVEFLYEEELSVQSLSVSPIDAFEATNITLSATIRNNSIAVQNKEVSFYRSDELLGTMTIASLAQNASTTLSFTTSATAGTGIYRAELPPDTNLANNSQSTTHYTFPGAYTIESFETSMQFSSVWSSDSPWLVNNTTVNRYDGNNYAVFDNGNIAHLNKRLSTPVLFRSSEDRIRFYYKTYNSPNTRIQYSMDGAEWITLRQLPNTSQVWTMHQVLASELPAPHTGIRYIAITTSTTSGYHYTFIDKAIFEAANIADPMLIVSENVIDVGDVPLNGVSESISLQIANGGGKVLQINSIELENPGSGFSLQSPSLPINLFQNENIIIHISFSAAIQGSASAQIVINSNAGTQNVSLHAYALLEATLSAYCGEVIFDDTPVGSSSIEEIVFYNSGDGVITLQEGDIRLYVDEQITLHDDVFEIIDANTYPILLQNQLTALIQVRFSPNTIGSYSSALVFYSGDTDLLSLPLSGNGIGGVQYPEAVVLNLSYADHMIILTWQATEGASSYRIESSDNPYSGFSAEQNQGYQLEDGYYSLQYPASQGRFYRVISIGR